ncbi:SPE_1075/MLC_0560 family membrane protein [Spiroplasma clarkii]|uniref:SPE_1075/MLC_0560 family membrane protein n=1 Tax=Spiroplasma clarkii TaxID=2139 RepID=UPI0011BAA061|nr:hypothetical protein [Spiroplasma clarkii]
MKAIWIPFATIVVTDLIITFVFPYFVNFFANPLGTKGLGVVGLVPKMAVWLDSLGASSQGVRSWMFVLAFIVFCFGIALWVKSTWAPGSYNSICTQFMALTKLNYSISRIICDLIIVAPAVVAVWFVPTTDGITPANSFFTNFSIATIAFVFVAGPIINIMINGIGKLKFLNFDKMIKPHMQEAETIKK